MTSSSDKFCRIADGPAEEDIDAATAVALDDVILPRMQLQVQQDSLPQRMKAIQLLGWVAKALAMRQHPRLAKPLETVLAYLEAASLDLATAEEGSATAEEEGTLDQPGKGRLFEDRDMLSPVYYFCNLRKRNALQEGKF